MRISDWSSDVCSSDLFSTSAELTTTHRNCPDPGPRNFRWLNLGSIDRKRDEKRGEISAVWFLSPRQGDEAIPDISRRSDERRVGKEWVSTCRSRWSQHHTTKKRRKQKHRDGKQ